MKTATTTLNITKSPAFEAATTTEATINRSAAAYKILSDSLYSNKILAVTREVICNALDITIKSQASRPALVTLPARFSERGCTFNVRDWGTGLSERDIRELALTYFGSNKTDNNTEIGGFGLGFKAPLAYSDSFHVISRQDGTESLYTVYFNEDRIPVVTKIAALPTEEPDGLEVSVPVKAEDIHSFEQTVKQIMYFIPRDLCTVAGAEFPYYLDHNPIINTEHFVTGNPAGRPTRHQAHVLMGMVLYPIDYQNVPPTLRQDLRLFDTGYLRADIGTLNVAPNREALSYDRYTIAKLRQLVDTATKEVQTAFEALLSTPNLSPAEVSKLRKDITHHFEPSSFLGGEFNRIRRDHKLLTIDEASQLHHRKLETIATAVLTTNYHRRKRTNKITLDQTGLGHIHPGVREPRDIVRFSLGEDRTKLNKILATHFSADEQIVFVDGSDEQVALLKDILHSQSVTHWKDRLPPAPERKTKPRAPSKPYFAMHQDQRGNWTKTRITKTLYSSTNAVPGGPVILAANGQGTLFTIAKHLEPTWLETTKTKLNNLNPIVEAVAGLHPPKYLPIIPLDEYLPAIHVPYQDWLVKQICALASQDPVLLAGMSLSMAPTDCLLWGDFTMDDIKLFQAMPSFLASSYAHNLFRTAPATLDLKRLQRTGPQVVQLADLISVLIRSYESPDAAPFFNTVKSNPPSPVLLDILNLMRKYPSLIPFMTRQHSVYETFEHYFTLVNNQESAQ